jgi:hypothetical protein
MSEFHNMIDKLTKNTSEFILRDDGLKKHHGDGLLQQLREAVFIGMSDSGGSAMGSRPPIAAAALDLLNEITEQAAEVLAAIDPHPTPYGEAEKYVRLWSAQVIDTTKVTVTRREGDKDSDGVEFVRTVTDHLTAMELVQAWISGIENYFDPPRTSAIPNPCPRCDARYFYKKKDGENIRSAALNLIKDSSGRTTEARCSHCAASWSPPQFIYLAHILGYELPRELSDTPETTVV